MNGEPRGQEPGAPRAPAPSWDGPEGLKIKICGLTSPADALLAVELGADFLGLNFYPPSPRSLGLDRAREIADAVAGRVPLVGVFVDASAEEIEKRIETVGLDLVQLHGDETPEEVARWGRRALQVFRRDSLPKPAELNRYPDAWGFLFDVPHESLYGGTGRSWAYETVAGSPELPERVGGRPVFLAGGVRPDNVAGIREAAARAGLLGRLPLAVDVCSGVESSPGIKDRTLLKELFERSTTEVR